MSNIINSQISANISTPLLFKEEEFVSLTDETLCLIGTAQKGPAFVPQQVTSFRKNDNILNTWENVFGDYSDQSTQFGPISARIWLESEKTQLSYTRVLGPENSDNVGFIVGDNVLSGSSVYGLKGSNPFSNTNGNNGRTTFLATICKNKDTVGYISPHKDYLGQLNIESSEVAVVTDVIMMTSGSSLYLQKDEIENINIISKKKDLSTKNNNELAFVGSTETSQSNPMLYIQGIKNSSKNVMDYYVDENLKNNFELNAINSDIDQILYRGHYSYAKFRNIKHFDKPLEKETSKHLVLTGSGGWNSGAVNYENFESSFKKARTPWIVSQPTNRQETSDFNKKEIFKKCKKLFRFFTYDDGQAGNDFRFKVIPRRLGNKYSSSELEKYSIFDIELYRLINDNFILLEHFKDLTLNPQDENYICKIIGTERDFYNFTTKKVENLGFYRKTNNYVYVEVHPDVEDQTNITSLIPCGFMPYPRLNIDENKVSFLSSKTSAQNIENLKIIQNPIKYVGNFLFSTNNTDKVSFEKKYWGILFDNVTTKKFNDILINGQSKKLMFDCFSESLTNNNNHFSDYSKYFKNDYIDLSNNIWIEDLEDNDIDTFNSFFHLEKILYTFNEENIKDRWNYAFYQRDGKEVNQIDVKEDERVIDNTIYKYVNIDELLQSNTLFDSQNSKFLHFDFMTFGGFDGLNLLDDYKREHHNFSILREQDGEIVNKTTGQTYDSYKTAIDIVVNDENFRNDILCLPGISHSSILKHLTDLSRENNFFVILDFPEYGFNDNSINENYDSFDSIIKQPYFYKNISNRPYEYSDEDKKISVFIAQGTDNTIARFKEMYLTSDFAIASANTVIATIENNQRIQVPPSILTINAISSIPVEQTLDRNITITPNFITYNSVLNRNFIYNNNNFDNLLSSNKEFDNCLNPIGLLTAGQEIKLLSSNTLNKNNKSIMKLSNNVRLKQTIIREIKNLLTVEPIFQGNSILFSSNSQSNSLFNLKSTVDAKLRELFDSFIDKGFIKNYSIYVDLLNLDKNSEKNYLNNTLQGTVSFSFFDPGPDNVIQLDINNLINSINKFTDSNDIDIINTTI